MLKQLLIPVLLGFLAIPLGASAEDEAAGLIFAKVSVQNGAATVESVHSSLPEDVLEKLHDILKKRAIQEAQREGVEESRYAVGIDWKVVQKDGRDQLAFDFSNGAARPLTEATPELPKSMLSINAPITATIHLKISALGEATMQDCQVSEGRFMDACKNAAQAFKKSVYAPAFIEGIGTTDSATQVLRFDPPSR